MNSRVLFLALLCGVALAHPQYGGDGGGDQFQEPPGLSSVCHPSYDCVPYFQCQDGVINTDGSNLLDLRTKKTANCENPDYPGVPAECCLIPGEPEMPTPTDFCAGEQVCVEYGLCDELGFVITDGAGRIDIRSQVHMSTPTCWMDSGSIGICCNPPKPPVLDYCPVDSECVPQGSCLGTQLDYNDQWVDPYAQGGEFQECSLPGDLYGVCCKTTLIDTCPFDSVCVAEGECFGKAMLGEGQEFVNYIYGGGDSYQGCYLDGHPSGGVCCEYALGSCPKGSICSYEFECTATAHTKSDTWEPYSIGDTSFTQCSIDSANYEYGVCCEDPYKAADSCGVSSSVDEAYEVDTRIRSNKITRFGEIPWQAIIFYVNYTFVGGATLISKTHLLTAAHNIYQLYPQDIKIRLGEWQVNSFDESRPYADYNVKSITVHDKFNPNNVHNDIAVIELAEPVVFDYHINRVCLPDKNYKVPAGTKCLVSGWGKDAFDGDFQTTLKKVSVPKVDRKECQKALRTTRLGKYFRLHKSFVCAGGEEGLDACSGDGGGPLTCIDPVTGYHTLFGLTAWGIDCGQAGIPGVYVNVPRFAKWITDNTYY